MNTNTPIIFIIVLLNIYCLWKINNGNSNSCIPKSGNIFLKKIRNSKK